MALTFTKETNGNVTVREGGAVVKCLQPDLHILCDTQNTDVLIISSTPNPYDEAAEFKFQWQTVTAPTYTDKEDLISKLCADFFNSQVTVYGDNAAISSVARSTSSVLLKAANTNRKELIIHNNASGSLFVSFVTPATVGGGVLIGAKETAFFDHSRTDVYGIWKTGGSGGASVAEITT